MHFLSLFLHTPNPQKSRDGLAPSRNLSQTFFLSYNVQALTRDGHLGHEENFASPETSGIARQRRADSIPRFSAPEDTAQGEGSLAQLTKYFQTHFSTLKNQVCARRRRALLLFFVSEAASKNFSLQRFVVISFAHTDTKRKTKHHVKNRCWRSSVCVKIMIKIHNTSQCF